MRRSRADWRRPEVSRLENAARARLKGGVWQRPIVPQEPELTAWRGQARVSSSVSTARSGFRCPEPSHRTPVPPRSAIGLTPSSSCRIGSDQSVSADSSVAGPAHATVGRWQLLEDIKVAFASGRSHPRVAAIRSGLSSLTVGVIPPALDQVLIGAIDRSRNPELKLAIVLGLNEEFPANRLRC